MKEMIYDLTCRYDARQCFYGKATVQVLEDGSQLLRSYNTRVAYINKDNKVFLDNCFQMSNTTLRHIKEFLKQNDFDDLAVNKATVMNIERMDLDRIRAY